jgi:hypothetical protein
METDFILLIMSCNKYKFKADKQRNMWLSNFDLMPYFHVIGEPNLKTSYIFNKEYKILYVKCEDDYNSLPKKVIKAYDAVHNEFSYKYIFKTDDDQYCNTKFLESLKKNLLKKCSQIHYGGKIINVDKPYISNYFKIHPELPNDLLVKATKYCNGRFYFLSKLAISDLLEKKESIYNELLEDYAIGYWLNDKYKENLLNLDTDLYFQDITIT